MLILSKAFELANTQLPEIGSEDLGFLWHDVLFARILLNEAKELIGGVGDNQFDTK